MVVAAAFVTKLANLKLVRLERLSMSDFSFRQRDRTKPSVVVSAAPLIKLINSTPTLVWLELSSGTVKNTKAREAVLAACAERIIRKGLSISDWAEPPRDAQRQIESSEATSDLEATIDDFVKKAQEVVLDREPKPEGSEGSDEDE